MIFLIRRICSHFFVVIKDTASGVKMESTFAWVLKKHLQKKQEND